MKRRVSPRARRRLRLAILFAGVALATLVLTGLLGLESHAAAVTWHVRTLLGGDGPSVVASGARDGAWTRRASTITLTAHAQTAAPDVASITYTLDGSSHTVSSDVARVTVPATDGTHLLVYHATDETGVAGATTTLTVHVDTVGPATETKSVTTARNKTVTLGYRIGDADSRRVGSVTAVIRNAAGTVVARRSLGAQETGVWLHLRWTPRTPGVYRYSVLATDAAGNKQSSATVSRIVVQWPVWRTIGRSVKGRRITVARFGSGSHRLLIVGGVHPNETGVPVARKLIAYVRAHPDVIPAGWRLDVIPCLNPDGYVSGTRGNARDVDLNRNFPSASWRRVLHSGDPSSGCGLSGGSSAGSEPETKALMAYLRLGFDAELSLHCDAGILDCHGPGGAALGKRMAALCSLPVGRLSYESLMTGTLEQYVAERYGIPAVTVELRDASFGAGLRRALLAACAEQ